MGNSSHKYSLTLVSILLVTLLSSCGKSPRRADNESEQFLQQAKQSDIPIPVGFKPIAHNNRTTDKNKTILYYHGDLDVEKSIAYYKQVMELNGWSLQDFSCSKEGLLFCRKAHKSCAISICNHTDVKIVLRTNIQHCASQRDVDIINRKKIIIS